MKRTAEQTYVLVTAAPPSPRSGMRSITPPKPRESCINPHQTLNQPPTSAAHAPPKEEFRDDGGVWVMLVLLLLLSLAALYLFSAKLTASWPFGF